MCLSITEPGLNDGPVELCRWATAPWCSAMPGWLQVGFGHPGLVVKETSASPGCPSLPGGKYWAQVSPLQPWSNVLRKHLDSPEPCLRHLGTSRCAPLIKQPAGKQQGLGDVQLITGVTSSAQSKLRQKEAICRVPLAGSSGTNRNYSSNISAALLLLMCRHTSGIILARQGSTLWGLSIDCSWETKVSGKEVLGSCC